MEFNWESHGETAPNPLKGAIKNPPLGGQGGES
jgi:hypothetical protein